MSSTTIDSNPSSAIPDRERETGSSRISSGASAWWPLAAIVIGHLPLVVWHFSQLLDKPHFQFVVLLPIAGFLLWMHLEDDRAVANQAQPVFGKFAQVVFLCAISLVLSISATLLWSPWIGMIAFLVAIFTWAYWSGVSARVTAILPVWVLAWTAVPPPLGLDTRLTVWLRGFATSWTGQVLDQFGIMHFTYGNVIEVPGKTLFVADACSGIHSLFVMFAAAVFLGLWNRRGWLHLILLVVFTFAIVLIENVARLSIIAIAWPYGTDLSVGTPHTILGFCLFIASLLILLSTDQLIRFILPEGFSMASMVDGVRSRLRRKSTKVAKGVATGRATRVPGMAIYCTILPVLGVLQLASKPPGLPVPQTLTQEEMDFPGFSEDTMPKTIGGFERTDYRFIERVEGDPLGKNSHFWEYKQADLVVQLSLDYPYAEPHDLCLCYYNTGWTIEDRKLQETQANEETFQEADIVRPLHGNALLLYCQQNMIGTNAASVTLNEKIGRTGESGDVLQDFVSRIKAGVGLEESKTIPAAEIVGPWYQIHVLAKHHREVNDVEKTILRRFFTNARTVLVNRINSATKKENN